MILSGPLRRSFAIISCLAIAVFAAGCGSAIHRAANDSNRGLTVRGLEVRLSPTRQLPVPYYRTRGQYLQIALQQANLRQVNKALAGVIAGEQVRYARLALIQERRTSPKILRRYPGIFQTLTPRLVSASTVVVSELIPILELFPGGNDGAGWLSVTLQVPSAAVVSIGALFSSAPAGLQAVALGVRSRLNKIQCFRSGFTDPIASTGFNRALEPRAQNFRYFALTSTGLAVGFPNGQVAEPACGRVAVVIPYHSLRLYLSPMGSRLVAGVRQPNMHLP